AVDSLVNSREWGRDDAVVLVTAGSPLRRFFFRFFPGIFIPESPAGVAHLARGRLGDFHWLNVYRPWDPIGTSLRLTVDGAGRDVSTGQRLGVLSAHLDYWRDPVVLKLVREAYDHVESWPVPAGGPVSISYWPDLRAGGHKPKKHKDLIDEGIVSVSRGLI